VSGVFLWVNAICINQDDVRERNDQVSLMDDIYGKAQQKLVWLGPDVNDSDHGLSLLRLSESFITPGTDDQTILQ
jgi:hypothetical protein